MKNWLAKTNKAYSTLCGEKVTNKDVAMTHGVLMLFLLGILIEGLLR